MKQMLDINFIKKNSDIVKKVISDRNIKGIDIDNLLKIYEDYLNYLKKSIEIRTKLKDLNGLIFSYNNIANIDLKINSKFFFTINT